MPSRLASSSRVVNDRAIDRARSRETRVSVQATGLWKGFIPDIDMNLLDATAARNITGLIARPDEGGRGEVLQADNGFDRVDPTAAALSDLTADWTDGNVALHNGGNNDVTGILEFQRTTALGVDTGA